MNVIKYSQLITYLLSTLRVICMKFKELIKSAALIIMSIKCILHKNPINQKTPDNQRNK